MGQARKSPRASSGCWSGGASDGRASGPTAGCYPRRPTEDDNVATGIDLGIDGLSNFREVGAGGFAITYAAYEADQDRTVAVKVLHEADDDGRRRFDRERRTMGNTTGHANIVTLFRSGFTNNGQRPYLVMEYLPGGSLQDRLDRVGPVPLGEAIALLVPIAEALGFSHAAGILHKDVKPANILVTEAGVAKLTDFGIAALKESNGTSQLAYSPAYSPPESFDAYRDPVSGQVIDPRDERADLYSLGATLFTLVTGSPPFDGSQLSTIRQIADNPVPPTRHHGVDAFLQIAMAKGPQHRYQSAMAFIDALEGLRTSAAPPGAPLPATSHVGIAPQPWPAPNQLRADPAPFDPAAAQPEDIPESGARRWPVVLSAIVVGLVAVGLVWRFGLADDPATVDPPAEALPADAVEDGSAEDKPPSEPGPDGEPFDGSEIVEEDGVTIYRGHDRGVRAAVGLPDGRIVSSGDNSVRIFDPTDPNSPIITYDGGSEAFGTLDMTLLSDGRIASGSGSFVNVWNPATPTVTDGTHGETLGLGQVLDVVELDDGRIASTHGEVVNIWHPSDPATTLATYSGHAISVSSLALLPDGRIASSSAAEIHVWDPDDVSAAPVVYLGHDIRDSLEAIANEDRDPDDPPMAIPVSVTDMVALDDGRMVSAARDGFQNLIHVWDPAQPDAPPATRLANSATSSMLLLSDGRVISGYQDGRIHIWNPNDANDFDIEYTGHTDTIWTFFELADGRIVSGSEDSKLHIWDPTCPTSGPAPVENLRCS